MYSAKVLECIKGSNGSWGGERIGVFEGDKQIGEYKRNYPSYADSTFFPFKHPNGKWYALYAEHYTCTCVMSLPECKKVAGEEPSSNGFCPVEYFIPTYWERFTKGLTEEQMKKQNIPEPNWHRVGRDRISRNYDDKLSGRAGQEHDKDRYGTELKYDVDLGFVAGCYWGDDSSWKIEQLDLSRVHEGILTRSDRMGYLEMPWNLRLKNAIAIHPYYNYSDEEKPRNERVVHLAIRKSFLFNGPEMKKAFSEDD